MSNVFFDSPPLSFATLCVAPFRLQRRYSFFCSYWCLVCQSLSSHGRTQMLNTLFSHSSSSSCHLVPLFSFSFQSKYCRLINFFLVTNEVVNELLTQCFHSSRFHFNRCIAAHRRTSDEVIRSTTRRAIQTPGSLPPQSRQETSGYRESVQDIRARVDLTLSRTTLIRSESTQNAHTSDTVVSSGRRVSSTAEESSYNRDSGLDHVVEDDDDEGVGDERGANEPGGQSSEGQA